MPHLNQDPGYVDVRCNQGNALTFYAKFMVDVAAYTWEAKVDGSLTITVAPYSPAAPWISGISLTLASSDTETLSIGDHHWKLDRTDSGNERTYLAGDFYVFEYKP